MLSESKAKLQRIPWSSEIELREPAAGQFVGLTECMDSYSRRRDEGMSTYQYQCLIVFLCSWKKATDTAPDLPYVYIAAKEWFEKQGKDLPPILSQPDVVPDPGEIVRGITGDDFLPICWYFADHMPKKDIPEMYKLCDQELFPTTKATKDALKNESTPETSDGSGSS